MSLQIVDGVITLGGEFDLATEDALYSFLSEHGLGETAVIDLSQVTYLDSSAIRCFIRYRDLRLKHGKTARIVLEKPTRSIELVLRLCGLEHVFHIVPANDAVSSD